MEKNQVASFRLVEFSISKSSFEIKNKNEIDNKLSIELKGSTIETQDDLRCVNRIDLVIDSKDKNLNIHVTADGLFEFDSNLTPEEKHSFCRINAPAIMFPYIRAYVSSLTTLSGIPPITLPTLNFTRTKKSISIQRAESIRENENAITKITENVLKITK